MQLQRSLLQLLLGAVHGFDLVIIVYIFRELVMNSTTSNVLDQADFMLTVDAFLKSFCLFVLLRIYTLYLHLIFVI
jgi:hypothetical protein